MEINTASGPTAEEVHTFCVADWNKVLRGVAAWFGRVDRFRHHYRKPQAAAFTEEEQVELTTSALDS